MLILWFYYKGCSINMLVLYWGYNDMDSIVNF